MCPVCVMVLDAGTRARMGPDASGKRKQPAGAWRASSR